jgi:hypothetical protein
LFKIFQIASTHCLGKNEFVQIQRNVRQEKDISTEEKVSAGDNEILVAQAGPGQPQLGH